MKTLVIAGLVLLGGCFDRSDPDSCQPEPSCEPVVRLAPDVPFTGPIWSPGVVWSARG